jgi:hypothetical protein
MPNTISRDLLKIIRVDIDAALDAIAKKHDVALKTGGCRFTDTNATFKLDLSVKGDGGVVITKDMKALHLYAKLLGVTDAHIATPFTFKGDVFTLAGYKPRADKFIIAKNGKMFVLTVDAVKTAFAALGKPFNPPA